MPRENVYLLIKARRKALKLSQQDMADKLSLCRRQYQYYESGTGRMGLEMLQDVCDILNLSVYIVPNECRLG